MHCIVCPVQHVRSVSSVRPCVPVHHVWGVAAHDHLLCATTPMVLLIKACQAVCSSLHTGEQITICLLMQAEMIHQIQDDQVMGPPSLAESRPNAYIPEDLGIPKPYGGFAPFKPSEPGSSMRHIRVPNPGEIVI